MLTNDNKIHNSLANSRPLLIVVLLISLSCLSFLIYQTDNQKREVKEDLIELSNIKYGLFNVDEWKKILTNIIAKKIEEFEVNVKNKEQLESKISNFLYKVVNEFEDRNREKNSGSIGGILENFGASVFDVYGKIRQDFPIITEQILDFMNDPKNKKALKSYLTSKLNEYADNTFAKLDYSIHDSIINKYKLADRSSTITSLDIKLDELQQTSNKYKYVLVLLAILAATFILFTKAISKTEFILLTSVCFLFLVLGLTLPMIEIDARVSGIKISLLGEQINFQDQVLYYKSKSNLEVVRLMITQGSFDLLLVGFLVFIFSVLFPISKLVSSICLISSPDLKSNKIIYFLVNKTGKWSMADVMVVAIFMSYIGFSGILTEQLHQLENLSSKIDVLTTNKSSLQIGFFAFTSFALLSLLTTNKLKSDLAN
jgi:hypothetical protein